MLQHENDRDRTRNALTLALGFVLAFGAALGCGVDSKAGLDVNGSVTLDGKPLPTGTISFATADGKSLGTAEVADGRYEIPAAAGLQPGSYQVEIISVVPTGKTVKNPDFPGETIEEVRNVIPPRYNVRSELKAELKPEGDRQFSFSLSTSKVAAKPGRGRS